MDYEDYKKDFEEKQREWLAKQPKMTPEEQEEQTMQQMAFIKSIQKLKGDRPDLGRSPPRFLIDEIRKLRTIA